MGIEAYRRLRTMLAAFTMALAVVLLVGCPGTPVVPNGNVNGNTSGNTNDNDNGSGSPVDRDEDGVPDVDDQCLGTAPGTEVTDDGCPVGQSGGNDNDNDNGGTDGNVNDNDNGGSDGNVNDNGGTDGNTNDNDNGADNGNDNSDPGADDDGDGIVNGDDDCPSTEAGLDVDQAGCAMNQLDRDDDGVSDAVDQCPETPEGDRVDENGCTDDRDPPIGGGGGGGGTTAVCGNSVVESGELCDPPDGTTCDDQCQTITGSGVANDNCADAVQVAEGTISIDTTGATTDGPEEPERCTFFGNSHIESDIWYTYTASCDGPAMVGLCGSSFDTKLAVYRGADCPTQGAMGCSDDNCGLSTESRITFTAELGIEYLIRIGGYETAQGEGLLTIYCGDTPTCGQGQGDCFAGHDGSTCEDEVCCDAVCAIDQYCCDVIWDDFCAGEAEGICNGSFAACQNGTGACDAAHDSGGCDSEACCQTVCTNDPFCCLNTWDATCAEASVDRCSVFDACVGATGDCFVAHHDPGCSDQACCLDVCGQDPFCCSTEWDETCAEKAIACRQ